MCFPDQRGCRCAKAVSVVEEGTLRVRRPGRLRASKSPEVAPTGGQPAHTTHQTQTQANSSAAPSPPGTATRLGVGSKAPPPLGDLVEYQRIVGWSPQPPNGGCRLLSEDSRCGCGGGR